MIISEKYRPKTFAEIIGQDKIITSVQDMARRGSLYGSALLLHGASGRSKTSLARVIVREYCGLVFGTDYLEYNGSDLLVDQFREIKDLWSVVPFGARHRHLIINEFQDCKPTILASMLTWLEKIRELELGLVVFTSMKPIKTGKADQTTLFEKLDPDLREGILRRCIQHSMNTQGTAPQYAARAKEIAMLEGLDGKPESVYLNYLNVDCGGNFGMLLDHVDRGFFKSN